MPNSDHNPGAGNGLQGTSQIYKFGTSPNTRSVVTQKVRILAPGYGGQGLLQIGVLSNFSPSESRTVDPVQGIGFGDIIAELVPSVTGAMEGSFERTMLYLSTLWQSTGYAAGISGPVRSLRHHRWPFDIEQQIVLSTIADREISGDGTGTNTGFGSYGSLQYQGAIGGGGPLGDGSDPGSHNILITYYEGCWWNQWSTSFAKDTAMVMESGSCTITDVHDFSSVQMGEFIASGNDPSRGETASIIYGNTFTS